MHPFRAVLANTPDQSDSSGPGRFGWARDFAIGWIAGLIFFGTMLS